MRQLLAAVGLWASVGCSSPASPTAGPFDPGIDTLEFVVGAADTWPRFGNQWQHQVVDPGTREVCWIKYGNPQMFECWRWDDAWIYHRVDHGIDGGTGESYEFTDGRWLPRRLSAPWTLDVLENSVRWFDPLCRVNESKSGPFPYRMHAWLEPAREINRDLGVREVLVLEYTPYPSDSSAYSERFFFARGAGWFSWENPRGAVRFDRLGGPRRVRASSCGEGFPGGSVSDAR
jgi:hypothetical protein